MSNENSTPVKGRLIKFKQGNRSQLPNLKVGEPAFCVDDKTFWIGSDDGNKQIVMAHELSSISVEDGVINFDKLTPELQNEINQFITLNDIPIVSSTQNGLMTPSMLTKLNNVNENATTVNVVDNVTSISALDALSARQGKLLNEKIEEIKTNGLPSNLFPATSSQLGGVKIGLNINVTSDGTVSINDASTSQKGVVKLNNTTTSTSTTEAATAYSVKQVYDSVSDKATSLEFTTTIGTSWSGSSAPYTQTISVSGILATDTPIIFPIYSNDNATAISQEESWYKVSKITTSNNSIILTCFKDKPTSSIPIQIKVIR